MIGVGIITYDRQDQFYKILNSIKLVDCVIAVKDGGKPKYEGIPLLCDFYELNANKGVGFCKNLLIQKLLEKGCDDIFLLEDDCLVKDNSIWNYCMSFSKESGLLHFNWNDYRHSRFATAQFIKHTASICAETEANFSYFHKLFLEKVRFDDSYINAWEHIDLELQGEAEGFLPPFRTFVSPSNLNKYLQLIDYNESTISGKELYEERVIQGHEHFKNKWGNYINDIPTATMEDFYNKMKEITLKYAKR